MSSKLPYEYTILRLVPRVEKEEFINIGVLLYCKKKDYLNVQMVLNDQRAINLFPTLDLDLLKAYLSAIEKIVNGDADGGPIACFDKASRYRWLTAQRSTLIQSSPTHSGITEDIENVFTNLIKEYLS